jgi:REP element-mobilizing transposase RayT
MAERLRRLEWIYTRSPIFFVTTCTARRHALLARDDVQAAILKYGEAGPAHGAWLGAFVLMPDHLHCFVGFDGDRIQLSIWVKSLKNAISKTLRAAGLASPHWQRGFFDHVLRSEESYEEKWNYVRDNPVRAGLVKCWEDWQFRGEPYDLRYR